MAQYSKLRWWEKPVVELPPQVPFPTDMGGPTRWSRWATAYLKI
jgi:hypothetical protein